MSLRVLVIEDEPEIADYLVRGLREEGLVVEHAADGHDARARLRAGPWDVVLLDWWLPGPDGATVLRAYRADGGTAPVLFLTARDAIPDRVRGLDAGADDYLCKPFAFDELLARVRALARRGPTGGGTTLSVAGVTVDLATRTAHREGKRLALTTKEEALLIFFLRHPDEVLSRTRIYEHVWDERYDGCSNSLEVHVVELRRKLEVHGPRLIHTLRGRGYRFGAADDPA
ncbi:response regulator transcription factor [Fimbriiglobus ruber]|uniref:Two-component response regulator n=1 Tax=Fimbriiglobus ruber TaxID=1908690 RepID=A0A225DVF7_9BACT|nr:response regulator transcription factor [Fimbriiglobus ruber]OWK41616.1 Two-component response regulator [Fimbriiglobus ruber]